MASDAKFITKKLSKLLEGTYFALGYWCVEDGTGSKILDICKLSLASSKKKWRLRGNKCSKI